MHVLQNAFESNWSGPGSTKYGSEGEDDEDEEEGKKEAKAKANLPMSLDKATTFSLDSANPNVAATSAQARGPVAARADCAERHTESSSDSASMEVFITLPTKRPRSLEPDL